MMSFEVTCKSHCVKTVNHFMANNFGYGKIIKKVCFLSKQKSAATCIVHLYEKWLILKLYVRMCAFNVAVNF